MRSPCSLCAPPPPPNKSWVAERIFMKLGIYIIEPELISKAYFINPSHQSVFLHVYSLSLLGNGSVIIPLSLLVSDSVKTL
jgi:hypothetical protein